MCVIHHDPLYIFVFDMHDTNMNTDAKTDFGNEHFDVVVLSNVLEHLIERVETLRALTSNVAPSRFLIRVPLFVQEGEIAKVDTRTGEYAGRIKN